MANIYDLANELERGIRALPEYQAVQAAKASIDADEKAKKIFYDYVAFNRELQVKLQTGQIPGTEVQEQMQSFQTAIQATPALKEYFNKQQALSVYVADLEKIIFQPLEDLMK